MVRVGYRLGCVGFSKGSWISSKRDARFLHQEEMELATLCVGLAILMNMIVNWILGWFLGYV